MIHNTVTTVSNFKLKRFLDKNWNENEKLEELIFSMNIDWTTGWLSIDDSLLEKPFSKKIDGVYYQYSSKINEFALRAIEYAHKKAGILQ